MKKLALTLMFLLTPNLAGAVVPIIDANVLYYSDNMTVSSATSSYTRTLWDIMFGMNLDKPGFWVLGWNYASSTLTENPGTQTSLTVTDMGPKLLVFLNKEHNWLIGFTYNLITKADYQSGATTLELRGSSMKIDAGYMTAFSTSFFWGARINYYKPSFNEEIQNTTLTSSSDSRTIIYPSFSLLYRFD